MTELFSSSNCEKVNQNLKEWNSNYVFLSKRELNGISEKNGILEAKDCDELNSVYHSTGAKIFRVSP